MSAALRNSLRNLLICVSLAGLAACGASSSFLAPEPQGPAAMVEDAGKPRLWILSKQEEQRQVAVGGGGRSSSLRWRTDTFFHFNLQAYDPVTTQRLWTQRVFTFGDPEAGGTQPSRVIGSAESGRMLGQEGAVVWLLIGDAPYAVNASDGKLVLDPAKLQEINPELKGLLPSEGKHYGFDRGLVLMSADARQFVVRGTGFKAAEYTPPPPPEAEQGPLRANGNREMVPMRSFGESPARQATLGGQWLGLYSQKEMLDASSDDWGGHLRWPYTVIDEGRLARRSFWRAKIATVQRWEDKFERLSELTPVAGGPTFLKGRFITDGHPDRALLLENPQGLLVLHSTRMDDAGRLALARIDANMKTPWRTELPLSETDAVRSIRQWRLPGHLVIVGELQSESNGVTSREPYLVSVDLATGAMQSSKLAAKDE